MIEVAVYDTKPYDREYLTAAGAGQVTWRFHDFRLSAETAGAARGAQAVCIFVNDQADRAALEILAGLDVRLVALLLTLPNVLITAHQAFLTREALGEIARVTTANLQRLEAGGDWIPGTEL